MKPLIQLRKTTPLLATVLLLLACFAMRSAPSAFGVVPPPDGGYPNFTTAEGTKALQNLTTGVANTGIGWYSLFSATSASFNTGVGAATLALNTGDNNTATGTAALFLNTTGFSNTAVGSTALLHNISGGSNTGIGAGALATNSAGNSNTATGESALFSNTTGGGNTADGSGALLSNVAGNFNTAIGLTALGSNTSGEGNTATGESALFSNIDGGHNTANGFEALVTLTTGEGNTAIGALALQNSTTGSNNTALGASAGNSVTTANNVIAIGTGGANVSFGCYIGNVWKQAGGSQAVYVNSDGKLGAQVSSHRFKDEIKPMEEASEVIYSLKPVSFRYKPEIEPARPLGFGLIAEEVEKINSDLVARDKEGKPYSVRYDAVNAMLLNEFLKEHRKNEEQAATIARLIATDTRQQRQIEALTSVLQKVSDQLELSKIAPQVATNNQ
jgi:hypothetical protein